MKTEYQWQQWVDGRCPTGKRGYVDRAGAKHAARSLAKTGSAGLRPYRCDQCDYWHTGHKPSAVLRGHVTAKEWYQP